MARINNSNKPGSPAPASGLPRYLNEFDFRYSTCKMSDTRRMAKPANQMIGKRLSYRAIKTR